MDFANRINQKLHDEHMATVALMERLQQFIAQQRRNGPPNVGDGTVARLLADLSSELDAEVMRHFAFEEDRLFTYLAEMNERAIGEHLTEEHVIMRPLGARVAELARTGAARGFDAQQWDEFCRTGQDLCNRLLGHVHKEEMALLPLLEDNMDPDTEARLVEEYCSVA